MLGLLRKVLLIWGALSLAAVSMVGGLIVFDLLGGSRIGHALRVGNGARAVLNWCHLGENRFDKLVHSHVDSNLFEGDYLTAYAMQISSIDLRELHETPDSSGGRWYRGDQLPAILADAVDFVGSWKSEVRWFPGAEKLRSAEFYLYPYSISCDRLRPTAAKLIFVQPETKMVYYIAARN